MNPATAHAATDSRPAPTTARRWQRRRKLLFSAILSATALAAVLMGAVYVGFDGMLRLFGASALVLLAVVAVAVGRLAVVLRRRLQELRHLPQLGRPWVTTHEDGSVVGLRRHTSGDVVLEVVSARRQTVVLDEDGAPDSVLAGGSTTSSWRIPGSAAIAPEQLVQLDGLRARGTSVRVVSEGVVALTGPVVASWRLESADGVVVRAG